MVHADVSDDDPTLNVIAGHEFSGAVLLAHVRVKNDAPNRDDAPDRDRVVLELTRPAAGVRSQIWTLLGATTPQFRITWQGEFGEIDAWDRRLLLTMRASIESALERGLKPQMTEDLPPLVHGADTDR